MADMSVSSSSTNSLLTSSSSTSSTNSTTASSTPSGTGSGNVLRITGMVSGLNVDQIVTQLAAPYQLQIDKVQQDMQTVQWKQQMYTNIISDVKSFQNTYFNAAAPDTNITSASFFNSMTATSSDTNSIGVTTTAAAAQGSYSVSINSLAQAATISGSSLNTELGITSTNNWSGGKIDFNIGGTDSEEITLDNIPQTSDTNYDCENMVNNINKQISQNSNLSGKIIASYVNDGSGSYVKFSNISGSSVQVTGSNISDINLTNPLNIISTSTNTTLSQLGFSGSSTLNLSYNNSNFSIAVKDSDTLGQLIQNINSQTSGQVAAKLDDITGSLILQTAETGSSNTLSIKNSTSDPLMKALGLSSLPTDSSGNICSVNGKDASLTISQPGGSTETLSKASNNFTLDGINFNLKNTTTTPVSVAVSSDADSVVTKFKGFMDKYNALISEVSTKVNEKVSYDYPPLTSTQKSQMSSSDIESWNTQAQVGLLHDDDNLSNMLSDLKNTLYNSVQGVISTIGSKIGVDLSSDYTTDGTLVFTDGTGDAFKQALQDPTCDVVNLFTKSAGISTGTDKYNNEGVFQRIGDVFQNYTGMTGVTSNDSILGAMANKQDSFSTYGSSSDGTFLDQIFEDKNKITQLQQEYTDKKNQYYQQFSNLESAMSELNNQSAALSQLSGG